MQTYLKSLTALHSAENQAQGSRDAGRPVRREPITTEHPLVRTNPVTGWNALLFNPGFVTQIVGVPKLESDKIIEYLTTIVTTVAETQARLRWNVNDVAMWDNRVCDHTATYGFSPHRRHAVRITPHGERPYLDPNGGSQEEAYLKAHGLKSVNKNGAGKSNYND
ncbi:alpha-ketoglutarate-dependent taurine dioxygenase [Ascosphaera apis ARSEF 7405]|uniref:Alpha-ketoglutarate-dependent taurine dioxygenase n=1 Tax=Ascosphaera apis ARSEF 7405 TaxID=392613 RepID=A0A167XQV2_9EURO|nr:alpha-ketoglutarate-dependent taurine dioxygenase [Ascosphaera apis ARSEF 7405]